jgi:antitoxin component of RelBE/YafQ-DinJ toxin-antitoxin module
MESCSHKRTFIRIRIDSNIHTQFKEYCTKSNTTMSTVLIDYITILLSKFEEVLPGEEKNSVKRTALTKIFHCPYCGEDITEKSEKNRKKHVKNCENGQNERLSF